MKRKYFVLLLLIFLSGIQGVFSQEFLEPEYGVVSNSWDTLYEQKAQNVFMKYFSTHPVFRMICLPSFIPEYGVEIKLNRSDKKYYVVAVKLVEPIYLNRKPSADIPAKKYIREIGNSITEQVSVYIQNALANVRYTDPLRNISDGENYHFCSFDFDHAFRYGKARTPEKGTKNEKLVKVGEAIFRYAMDQNMNSDTILDALNRK